MVDGAAETPGCVVFAETAVEADAPLDTAGAELVLPRVGKSEGVAAPVVPVAPAPLVAPGALVAGAEDLPRLNKEEPPAVAPVLEALVNRPPDGPAADAWVLVFPPKLKAGVLEEGGWEEAAVVAGVFPRLNAGALLAAVAPVKSDGLGAS